MAKEEWGVKRVCPETGKRFYDLGKDPVVSPYTGEVVPVDTGTKTRVLVADKDDAASKKASKADDDDLLLDDDDVEEEDEAADVADDDVLDDDEDDDTTVSLNEIGGDVADTDDDD
ncbi:TIGR02300 family protein [Jannaschia sp. Os4]|uniref:TIGR02300 family protein n=1 Tax=Jannaschia sp. Os4 TaxID=2807617 RepID=UPI0019394254|nr:TIGR02300 family protein [Jannaschia sp. Os4]MBM2575126.1 TIGR02300 family protein [Jannaschia sp. Os4]